MEYGLRHEKKNDDRRCWCLNPCCNGIWSQTSVKKAQGFCFMDRLNPCCNGIWSQTEQIPARVVQVMS